MFEKIKEFFRRNKFKKGDKVYVNKRGEFDYGVDWTLSNMARLEKNKIYVVKNVCGKNYITLNPNGFFYYHYKHFKKYEQV